MKNSVKINKGHLLLGLMLIIILFLETKSSYGYFEPVVSVKGNVLSQKTDKGINSSIQVFDSDNKLVFRTRSFESNEGQFYITGLKPNKQYKVIIKSEGHEELEEIMPTPNVTHFIEIKKEFKLQILE